MNDPNDTDAHCGFFVEQSTHVCEMQYRMMMMMMMMMMITKRLHLGRHHDQHHHHQPREEKRNDSESSSVGKVVVRRSESTTLEARLVPSFDQRLAQAHGKKKAKKKREKLEHERKGKQI